MEETQHALLLFRATTTRAPRSGGRAKWGCQACTHLAGALLADEAGCDGQRKPVVVEAEALDVGVHGDALHLRRRFHFFDLGSEEGEGGSSFGG